MREKILAALKQLEHEHECRILFAAESGSRAWGFASPDSDYDIRAIYVKPLDWYLSIEEKPQDTFEAMLPEELDVSAWELRKALRLFAGCNLPLMEWLGSPIQYYSHDSFADSLKALIPRYFNAQRAGHFYFATMSKALPDLDVTGTIGIKKLFYVLRGLFAALWCVEKQTMPPTEFIQLLKSPFIPSGILNIVFQLLEQKRLANEKERVLLPEEMKSFIDSTSEIIQTRVAALGKNKSSPDALNALCRQLIRRNLVS